MRPITLLSVVAVACFTPLTLAFLYMLALATIAPTALESRAWSDTAGAVGAGSILAGVIAVWLVALAMQPPKNDS